MDTTKSLPILVVIVVSFLPLPVHSQETEPLKKKRTRHEVMPPHRVSLMIFDLESQVPVGLSDIMKEVQALATNQGYAIDSVRIASPTPQTERQTSVDRDVYLRIDGDRFLLRLRAMAPNRKESPLDAKDSNIINRTLAKIESQDLSVSESAKREAKAFLKTLVMRASQKDG